jgi:hypothetical protein
LNNCTARDSQFVCDAVVRPKRVIVYFHLHLPSAYVA